MSALTYDPWAALKMRGAEAPAAKPANPANRREPAPESGGFAGVERCRAEVAGLAANANPANPPPPAEPAAPGGPAGLAELAAPAKPQSATTMPEHKATPTAYVSTGGGLAEIAGLAWQASPALKTASALKPPIPTDAAALLAHLRDDLHCRVTVEPGDILAIRPTHRCPPSVLAVVLALQADVRAILQAEAEALAAPDPPAARQRINTSPPTEAA